MKKLLQDALAPVCLFTFGLLLLGCDQPHQASNISNDTAHQTQEQAPTQTELKSGNMLYVIRDVADVQLKTGNYIEQLQQTQTQIKNAIELKDHAQLESSVKALKQQLTAFNQTLDQLHLKSQEINDIRQNIMATNQKVLNSSYLNGKLNLSAADFEKIEQQMGNIQSSMMQLAKMFVDHNHQEIDSEK